MEGDLLSLPLHDGTNTLPTRTNQTDLLCWRGLGVVLRVIGTRERGAKAPSPLQKRGRQS